MVFDKGSRDWRLNEETLLRRSKIICTTLSCAGMDQVKLIKNYVDYLIVDEACQATEPSSLIPLDLNPKRVIFVGDQNQLPATTISDNAPETNF